MGIYDEIKEAIIKMNRDITDKLDVIKMLLQQLVELNAKIESKPSFEIKPNVSDIVGNFIRGGP